MPKIMIARQEHQCVECGEPILKGKPFTYRITSSGRHFPVHPECGVYYPVPIPQGEKAHA